MGNSPNYLIGTLNFSGICLSPFEYHDCSVEKDYISSKFQQVMEKEFAQQFKKILEKEGNKEKPKHHWKVGKIDQLVQKQRYTPIYNDNVGFVGDKLLNREEFEAKWDQRFEQCRKKIYPPDDKKSQQQRNAEINQCRVFDWLCYVALLNVVYNESQKSVFDLNKIKDHSSTPFRKFLQKWHSRSYLDNSKKIQKVIHLVKDKKFDILSLQEVQVDEQKVKHWQKLLGNDYEFIYDKTFKSTSTIIIRKQKFPHDPKDKQFENAHSSQLNFNDDTTIAKRGEFLIISGHLSSKKQKYQKQAVQMFTKLQQIVKDHKLKLLVGLDCNHYMNPVTYNKFNIVPQKQTTSTSIKKRTAMQLQTKKVNLIVMQTKDQIVTNLPVLKHRVVMIDQKQISDKTYLPSDQHPFDHFLVWAQIALPQKTKS